MICPKYISPEGGENLKRYKINCVDYSLYSRLFFDSFWDFLASKIPIRVAPNVLTLCGLCFAILGAVLAFVYCPTTMENVPWLVYLTYVILSFLYQTALRVAEKHAHRTKSESPLGYFFIQVTNVIAMGTSMMMLSSVLHGGPISSVIVAILGIAAHWFYHWKAYYTGITTTNDLMLLEILVYFAAFVFGTESLSNTLTEMEYYTVGTVIQIIFGTLFGGYILKNIYNVYDYVSEERNVRGCASFNEVLKTTIHYDIFVGLSIMWAILSSWDIEFYPLWYIFVVTMGSACMSQRLITQRFCGENIKQVKTPTIIMCIVVLNTVLDYIDAPKCLDVGYVLFAAAFLMACNECISAVAIIRQMCDILNIEVFRINTEVAETALAAAAAFTATTTLTEVNTIEIANEV